MSVKIDILNESYEGEELLVENFSGEFADFSEELKEVVTLADIQDLKPGHWVTVLDGEVIEASEFCPYRIKVE